MPSAFSKCQKCILKCLERCLISGLIIQILELDHRSLVSCSQELFSMFVACVILPEPAIKLEYKSQDIGQAQRQSILNYSEKTSFFHCCALITEKSVRSAVPLPDWDSNQIGQFNCSQVVGGFFSLDLLTNPMNIKTCLHIFASYSQG